MSDLDLAVIGNCQIGALLDRTWRGQASAQGDLIPMLQSGSMPLSLTAWPVLDEARQTEHLVVEVRETSQAELSLVMQREIAERMLLSALHERASAESAAWKLSWLAWFPAESTLTRVVTPLWRSWRKTSERAFVSPATRFVAVLSNAT